MLGSIIQKLFYYKEVIKRYINNIRESCGLHICSIYDDNFHSYTGRYYFYTLLTYITTHDYTLPNSRYTIIYLLDGMHYKYCIPPNTVFNYTTLRNKINNVIHQSQVCMIEDLWNKFAITNSIDDVNAYKRIRNSDILSIAINDIEYRDTVVGYINMYYVLNESLTLSNIIYDDINIDSTVIITTKKFGQHMTCTLNWNEIKDIHIYFLF